MYLISLLFFLFTPNLIGIGCLSFVYLFYEHSYTYVDILTAVKPISIIYIRNLSERMKQTNNDRNVFFHDLLTSINGMKSQMVSVNLVFFPLDSLN